MLAAVQGLSVNLYPSQIFCLLGHNGAGKTTTINMLSGMLPVDEGDAIMYGRSVRKDMPSIRKILGVCPQHDVIWAQLTVHSWATHLQGFNRARAQLCTHAITCATKVSARGCRGVHGAKIACDARAQVHQSGWSGVIGRPRLCAGG